MKRCSLPFSLLLLALMALPAFAADSWFAPYVEAKLGGTYTQAVSIKHTTPISNPATPSKGLADDFLGVAGIAAGWNFKGLGVPVRAELEYSYRTALAHNANPTFTDAGLASSLKSNLYSQTLFANVYLDINTGTAFTPYVGGGIGTALNHTRTQLKIVSSGAVYNTYGTEKSTLAWNIGAGCAYDLTENWKLNAGYRFVDLGQATWGEVSTAEVSFKSKDITSHEVMLGLRYQF